jgi:hypothetical protein
MYQQLPDEFITSLLPKRKLIQFETYFSFKQLVSKPPSILSLKDTTLYCCKQDFVSQTHCCSCSWVWERRYKVAIEGIGFGCGLDLSGSRLERAASTWEQEDVYLLAHSKLLWHLNRENSPKVLWRLYKEHNPKLLWRLHREHSPKLLWRLHKEQNSKLLWRLHRGTQSEVTLTPTQGT